MESKKVTKFDLVEAVYLKTKYEKKTVQAVLESLLENIKSSLKDGSTIELRGFGTFELRLRKGRSRAQSQNGRRAFGRSPLYSGLPFGAGA